jgi:hypothetical protein
MLPGAVAAQGQEERPSAPHRIERPDAAKLNALSHDLMLESTTTKRIARPSLSKSEDVKTSSEQVIKTGSHSFALTGKTDAYLEQEEQRAQLASQSAQLAQPFIHPSARMLPGWSQVNEEQLEGLRQWMAKTYPDSSQMFAKLPTNAIINIKGECDHEEEALQALGMHFRSTTRYGFKKLDLSGTRVVILNCSGPMAKLESGALLQFIKDGGCLVETDWAAKDWLCRTFPEFKASLCWNGTVTAHVSSTESELAKGCVSEGPWTMLAGLSWCHYGASSEMVPTPIVESEVLSSNRFFALFPVPSRCAPAFCLRVGKGRILHLAGHFDASFRDVVPSMGTSLRQAILMNFLMTSLAPKPNGTPEKSAQDSHV